jgi:VWFA-related protein
MRIHRQLFLIAMAAASAPAQETTAPLMIRAESRLVLVDAVVADKKGKPVRDLNASDFRLWEDGQERRISIASRETAGGAPDKGRKSYLLLFFDSSTNTTATLTPLRREAARFVEASASPDRYMAVAYFTNVWRVAQNFTSMAEPVNRAINAAPATAPEAVRAVNLPAIVGGVAPQSSAVRPPMGPVTPGGDDVYTQSVMFPGFRAVVESMGAIRGRKALVLFSGGFPRTSDLESQVAATAAACNRANVAVYVVDSGTALRPLAEQTGGRYVGTGADLMQELGKILDEQEEHYQLGFVPPEAPEGSCHTLRVKVERAGVDVRARNGYCTVKPADPLADKPAGKAVEERAAAAPGNLTASMQLPYFYQSANLARVIVAMEISLAGIQFQKVKGKLHAEMSLVGVAEAEDGSVGGRFSDTVRFDFDSDKEAAAFLKQPYHYENQFYLGAGRYRFRMLFSMGEDNFGKAEMPLAIAPWDAKSLAVSGVAIAASTRQIANLAAALDDALLEDRRPLIAGTVETTPSGDNRCRRESPCNAYIEVYEPLLSGPKPPALTLQIRFLDARTGEQKLDSGRFSIAPYVRAGNPVVPAPLTLPVAQLAPGVYSIEIRAASEGGAAPAVRLAELKVD